MNSIADRFTLDLNIVPDFNPIAPVVSEICEGDTLRSRSRRSGYPTCSNVYPWQDVHTCQVSTRSPQWFSMFSTLVKQTLFNRNGPKLNALFLLRAVPKCAHIGHIFGRFLWFFVDLRKGSGDGVPGPVPKRSPGGGTPRYEVWAQSVGQFRSL